MTLSDLLDKGGAELVKQYETDYAPLYKGFALINANRGFVGTVTALYKCPSESGKAVMIKCKLTKFPDSEFHFFRKFWAASLTQKTVTIDINN